LRRPRSDRRLAARAEPGSERAVTDPYEVLGVSRDATREQIVIAYLRAVAGDGGGGRERSAQIHEAYELLSDPERRAEYDSTERPEPALYTPGVPSSTPPPALEPAPQPLPHPNHPLTRNIFPRTLIAIDWARTSVGASPNVLAL